MRIKRDLGNLKKIVSRPFTYILLFFVIVNLFLIDRYLGQKQKASPTKPPAELEEELPVYQGDIEGLPTPRPLPQGKVGFTVGGGEKQAPQLRGGFIDPYDPAVGEKQMVSIAVKDQNPVKSVSVIMRTDNGSKKYKMELVGGTKTDGRWEATWTVEDTHLYTYNVVLEAVGKRGAQKVEMTLR